jgi:hypothetical protein
MTNKGKRLMTHYTGNIVMMMPLDTNLLSLYIRAEGGEWRISD